MAYRRRRAVARPRRRNLRSRRRMMPKKTSSFTRYVVPTHYYKRYSNVATSFGFSTAGALVVGSTNNLVFQLLPTAGTLTYGSFSYNVQLRDIAGNADLTALYDKYSIMGVLLRIIPYNTQSDAGAAISGSYGQSGMILHTVLDFDDDVKPAASEAGISTLREYSTYKVQNLLRSSFKRYTKTGKLTAAVAANSTVVGNTVSTRPIWFDASSTQVPHYAIKGVFEGYSGGSSGTEFNFFMKVESTVYLRCKDTR